MSSKEVSEVSANPLVLDPEFEEVLREVASDPDSTLLRVPRPQVVRGLFERDEAVSVGVTCLSRAERHLIQVRRNELAWLLGEAAFYKLVEGPVSKEFVSRYGPREEDRSPIQPAALQKRLLYAQAASSERDPSLMAVQLLLECVRQPLGGEPHVSQLAAASHRLQPTNRARLQIAVDMCIRNAPRTGLKLAKFVLSAHPSSEHVTRAWEAVALAYAKMGRIVEVHRAYRAGCTSDDPHTEANRLLFALQAGDRHDAVKSSSRLNDMLQGDSPSIAWYVETRLRRRLEGEWAPTKPGAELAKSMMDKFDGVARRIAHVMV
jgi:hypothetical protein